MVSGKEQSGLLLENFSGPRGIGVVRGYLVPGPGVTRTGG